MSHTYQSHLTVVIGNPNKEMQTVIAQEAKDQGGMEEDVWFDYVREQFEAGTTQIAPHYMSHIDFMLSTMLGDDVRVANLLAGLHKGMVDFFQSLYFMKIIFKTWRVLPYQ